MHSPPQTRFFLITIFCTVFISKLFAQQVNFITPLANISLTLKEVEMKVRVLKNKSLKHVEFVKLGNLPGIQKGGVLKFSIPGRLGEIEARARRVKASSVTNYEWYGEINNGTGHVIALNQNGKLTVSIALPDGEVYDFFYTDMDRHCMVQYDKEKLVNWQCGNDAVDTNIIQKTSFFDSKHSLPFIDPFPFTANSYFSIFPTINQSGPNANTSVVG